MFQSDRSKLKSLCETIKRDSLPQFKTLLFLMKTKQSPKYIVKEIFRAWKNLAQGNFEWVPETLNAPGIVSTLDASKAKQVGFFIHIFNFSYLYRLETLLERGPEFEFHVTCSNPQLKDNLITLKRNHANLISLIFTENRGRNFGPMFVQFSETIQRYKFIVHLHSKSSIHMHSRSTDRWGSTPWKIFEPGSLSFLQATRYLDQNPDVNLAYVVDLSVTPPSSFRWALNREIAQSIFPESQFPEVDERFSFPAGGMFLVRVDAISDLLQLNWSIEKFPIEDGQLDGTIQHAIERLIGVISKARAGQHIFYVPTMDGFTKDMGFLWADSLPNPKVKKPK
jgi:lipopolysaccharide biosynthesis protein